MEHQFWFDKWENNDLPFHEDDVNPLLTSHLNSLSLNKGDRVFVPLCGKTLDIAWLLSKGYQVVGVELVEIAVKQLFEELQVEPEITNLGELKLYHADNLDIYVGDIFDLTMAELGDVNAVYDRAAFVALPKETRSIYVKHIAEITKQATQLLITYKYDETLMDGPPFSSTEDDVHNQYSDYFLLNLLLNQDIDGDLKGHPAIEYVWLLTGNS